MLNRTTIAIGVVSVISSRKEICNPEIAPRATKIAVVLLIFFTLAIGGGYSCLPLLLTVSGAGRARTDDDGIMSSGL